MKRYTIYAALCGIAFTVCTPCQGQTQETNDSTDMFWRHLQLNEVVVTGVTGDTKLKHTPSAVSLLRSKDLRQIPSTNIVDAIAKLPGLSQITTGGGISKPVIRGLGYNRVVVSVDGVRQEGQQWGDEHGLEVDGASVHSVEILKGPASLLYGSDALAGVVILHTTPIQPEGEMAGSVSTEYQTNNGLVDYSLHFGGNQKGWLWDVRYSGKWAHAYKNKYDGYVAGSQFREQAVKGMFGVMRTWGQSRLTLSYYHLTPSIVEGERDAETGELECATADVKTYSKALPFQHVKHYKAVWDNSLYIGDGQLKANVSYQQNQRQEYEESADDYGLYFQTHTLGYDFRYLSEEHAGWRYNFGLNGMYQRSLNKGEEFLIPAYSLFDIGLSATASRTIDRWTINGGLRVDRRWLHSEEQEEEGEMRFESFNRNFTGLSGSVGAVFNANRHLNIRMNLARGFRAPNLSELGSNGEHEGTLRYELGNKDLKSENSWQIDLGMDYSGRYIGAELALFANRIDHYIFASKTGELSDEGHSIYAFQQGDAVLMGLEAHVDFHPIHSLHFGNSFSMVSPRQMHQPEESRWLPFTPAPRWLSEVKWEINHHGKIFNNSYISFEVDQNFRQNHFYEADGTETATPYYALLNLSAGADIMVKGKKWAEVCISGTNLTNRAYQSHLSRLKYADENPVTGHRGIYNMGRNIIFKATLFF